MGGSQQHSAVAAVAVVAAVMLVVSQAAFVYADHLKPEIGSSVERDCNELFGEGELQRIVDEYFNKVDAVKPSGPKPYSVVDVERCESQVVNGVINSASATLIDSAGARYRVGIAAYTSVDGEEATMVRLLGNRDLTLNGSAPRQDPVNVGGSAPRQDPVNVGGSVVRDCDELFEEGELQKIVDDYFAEGDVEKPSGPGPYSLVEVGRCESQVVDGIILGAEGTISDSVGGRYNVGIAVYTPPGGEEVKMVRIFDDAELSPGSPGGSAPGGSAPGQDPAVLRQNPTGAIGGGVVRECSELFGEGELERIVNGYFVEADAVKPSGAGPYSVVDVGRCQSQVVNGIIASAEATIIDNAGARYNVGIAVYTPPGGKEVKMVRIFGDQD